mmetsp:Transcript_90742/g.174710  ORF Transcript_90742/g.174710 Transcript_90742/m.174710 type:complete len:162 (+) Transcript_90742:3-488(+)
MSQVALVAGQDLFTYGAEGKAMYYVVDGEILYYEGAVPALQETAVMGRSEFFCEPVLWMKWEHMGRATARMLCEMILIDAPTFQGISTQTPELQAQISQLRFHYEAMLKEGVIRAHDIFEGSFELQMRITRQPAVQQDKSRKVLRKLTTTWRLPDVPSFRG